MPIFTSAKWKCYFSLYKSSPYEISVFKKFLVFRSENQVIIEISSEIQLWFQLVPQAALPFSGPELLVRAVLHFGVTAVEPCGCAVCSTETQVPTDQPGGPDWACKLQLPSLHHFCRACCGMQPHQTSELRLLGASSLWNILLVSLGCSLRSELLSSLLPFCHNQSSTSDLPEGFTDHQAVGLLLRQSNTKLKFKPLQERAILPLSL